MPTTPAARSGWWSWLYFQPPVSILRAVCHSNRGLDLPHTLQDRFGIDRSEDLVISAASPLIDELKGHAHGTVGR